LHNFSASLLHFVFNFDPFKKQPTRYKFADERSNFGA